MKYQITNEELNNYIKLAELKRKSPCRECKADQATCTGCQSYYDWVHKMDNLKVKECPTYISNYIEAMFEVEDCNKEISKIRKKRNEAIERLSSYKDIEII